MWNLVREKAEPTDLNFRSEGTSHHPYSAREVVVQAWSTPMNLGSREGTALGVRRQLWSSVIPEILGVGNPDLNSPHIPNRKLRLPFVFSLEIGMC